MISNIFHFIFIYWHWDILNGFLSTQKKTLILILKMTNIFAHNVFNSQKWLLYSKINFFYMGLEGGGGANSSLHPLSEKRGCTCPPTPPLATGLLETPSYPDKYCTEVTNWRHNRKNNFHQVVSFNTLETHVFVSNEKHSPPGPTLVKLKPFWLSKSGIYKKYES